MTRYLALAIVLMASVASGQTVPVRSGEHPGFSRIVFDFGTLPDWEVFATDGGYQLRTSSSRGFRLQNIFRRMPPSRFLDVRQTDQVGTVEFLVGCACEIDVFEHRGTALVVDLRDREEGFSANLIVPERIQPVQARQSLESSTELVTPLALPLGIDPPRPQQLVVRPGRPGNLPPAPKQPKPFTTGTPGEIFRDVQRRLADTGTARSQSSQIETLLEPDYGQIEMRRGLQGSATQRTLELLGRAAAQGLVDPIQAADAQSRQLGGTGDVSALSKLGQNIEVTTSIDRANLGTSPGRIGATGGICIRGSSVNVASWGSLEKGYDEISKARAKLVGEFDIPDFKAVRRLSRLYIYLGFGAEARAVLNAFPSDDTETALLFEMAHIVDGTLPTKLEIFKGQISCDSEAALWAALGERFTSADIARTRNRILATFSDLPPHLRRQLGPVLIERMAEAGDNGAAESILSAVGRDGYEGDDRLAVAVATLADAMGRKASEAQPDDVAGDSEILVETILDRIQRRAREGLPPGDEDMALLPVLAFEFRGTQRASELREAEIEGFRRRGDISSALNALQHAQTNDDISQDEAERLFRAVALSAAADLEDASLLVFAETADQRLGTGDVSAQARNAIADRLIELGFPVAAQRMVKDLPARSPDATLRRAKISLLEGNPSEALLILENLSDDRAPPLRAQAYLALTQTGEAARIWEEIGDIEKATASRQRSGEWSQLTSAADPVSRAATLLRSTANVALSDLNGAAISKGTFRDAAEKNLESLTTRRQSIEALLSATQSP